MKLHKHLTHALAILFVMVLAFAGCKKEPIDPIPSDDNLVAEFDAEAALRWNEVFLVIERYAAGYRPGPAPRSLAYMGLAAYEACLNGMPKYNSMESRYAGLSLPKADPNKVYHWPTVVHSVYSTMMPKFFPTPQPSAGAQMNNLITQLNSKYLAQAGQEVYDRSIAHGRNVADVMWAWAATDPYGHDAYRDPFGNFTTNEVYNWQDHYTGPPNWVATTPGPGKGMGPYFGRVRTFAISEAQKLSRPPLPYSESPTSELYAQALQVYSQNTPTLSHEAEWVGEFWSDDLLDLTFSPGPRWTAIANQIIDKEKVTLEVALEAYAKVGLALNDSAVACWHSKYTYNWERPQSYIRRVIDPNWEPALYNPLTGDLGVTPSFPAYPSGHSTMGAAGAEALASVFGYAYGMTDRCHEGRTEFEGTPRTFGSLYEMAYENAWSRVPLGVHFWMDCQEGLNLGTLVGREVNRLPWKK